MDDGDHAGDAAVEVAAGEVGDVFEGLDENPQGEREGLPGVAVEADDVVFDCDDDGSRGLQALFNRAAKSGSSRKPCILCYLRARIDEGKPKRRQRREVRFFDAGGMDDHYQKIHGKFMQDNKRTRYQCKKCNCWFERKTSKLYKWHLQAIQENH